MSASSLPRHEHKRCMNKVNGNCMKPQTSGTCILVRSGGMMWWPDAAAVICALRRQGFGDCSKIGANQRAENKGQTKDSPETEKGKKSEEDKKICQLRRTILAVSRTQSCPITQSLLPVEKEKTNRRKLNKTNMITNKKM